MTDPDPKLHEHPIGTRGSPFGHKTGHPGMMARVRPGDGPPEEARTDIDEAPGGG